MKVRRAVGCCTSAALVARFNRGWCAGSLTADSLRNAKHLHGRLVILTVRRTLRAGPRAYRASAPGQNGHRSQSIGKIMPLVTRAHRRLPAPRPCPHRESSVALQAGREHATQSGAGCGRGAVCFAARRRSRLPRYQGVSPSDPLRPAGTAPLGSQNAAECATPHRRDSLRRDARRLLRRRPTARRDSHRCPPHLPRRGERHLSEQGRLSTADLHGSGRKPPDRPGEGDPRLRVGDKAPPAWPADSMVPQCWESRAGCSAAGP
jgi:hypothetical protein